MNDRAQILCSGLDEMSLSNRVENPYIADVLKYNSQKPELIDAGNSTTLAPGRPHSLPLELKRKLLPWKEAYSSNFKEEEFLNISYLTKEVAIVRYYMLGVFDEIYFECEKIIRLLINIFAESICNWIYYE